jgi:hypothetical protein
MDILVPILLQAITRTSNFTKRREIEKNANVEVVRKATHIKRGRITEIQSRLGRIVTTEYINIKRIYRYFTISSSAEFINK